MSEIVRKLINATGSENAELDHVADMGVSVEVQSWFLVKFNPIFN